MGGGAPGKPRGAVQWQENIFPTIATPWDPLINQGYPQSAWGCRVMDGEQSFPQLQHPSQPVGVPGQPGAPTQKG